MLKNKILEILKIGRVRRRKKYQRGDSQSLFLPLVYLWYVFVTGLKFTLFLVPGRTLLRPFFSCYFVYMVSAGSIETDELINELDRPGKCTFFYLIIIVMHCTVFCDLVVVGKSKSFI